MGNRLLCSSNMCPNAATPGNELFDDTTSCDPAGAVFNETLEDLNEVDSLLMVFASAANLAGVRWLFVLGANPEACDTNGTTCLHAACRKGSLAIVKEFIMRATSLNTTDAAGWTPLHVALFMGRRQVAMQLLQHGADPLLRNGRGQLPAELSSDVWLREAVSNAAAQRQQSPGEPWRAPSRINDLGDIEVSSRLRFEPFFVPRAPVVRGPAGSSEMQRLALEIFNLRPGQGLAFIVAVGCARDFPVELSGFLSESYVDPVQVGQFLGEDFSLSQTLRLEYINSVRLVGTGVVACLARVFQLFVIPTDMQKIDRLVDGIAQIWWRQHEQIADPEGSHDNGSSKEDETGEVQGVLLMKYVGTYDVLYQLMFATILLHWNLYAPLPPSQRLVPEQWLELNAGLGSEQKSTSAFTLRHVQSLIYNMISHSFYPQLEIWKPRSGGSDALHAATSPRVMHGLAKMHPRPPLEPLASGWGRLVAGGFPSLALAGATTGMITYRHLRGILSEATSTTKPHLASPMPSRSYSRTDPSCLPGGNSSGNLGVAMRKPLSVAYRHPGIALTGGPSADATFPMQKPDDDEDLHSFLETSEASSSLGNNDRAWMVLYYGILFLAPRARPWTPYAFLHIAGLNVSTDARLLQLTLSPSNPTPKDTEAQPASTKTPGQGGRTTEDAGKADQKNRLQIVFLLPDGRWQTLEVARFQVQVSDTQQLQNWQRQVEACMPDPGQVKGGNKPTSKPHKKVEPETEIVP
eukprot:TRINITY_DN23959_c0_g1_i2.p1 TRINITY_DN23959_c0_g1~~TRINITY_DN23959_c0_g1_i2.p1  ORF type:complete len:748 (-),score=139.28 TRINITY_DN23959_c0_g1_i2:238-2481(-)